jgi:hypothetical protein
MSFGILLFGSITETIAQNQFDTRLPPTVYTLPDLGSVIYPKGTPKITIGFGASGVLSKTKRIHSSDGIYIKVPIGTAVYASVGGRAILPEDTEFSTFLSITRKMPVYTKGTVNFKRYTFTYTNLSDIKLEDRDSVRAGQKIGTVGEAGSYVHLTITLKRRHRAAPFTNTVRKGKYLSIDPLYFLMGQKTNMILCRDKNRRAKDYRRVFKTAKHGYRLAHGLPLALYPVSCN